MTQRATSPVACLPVDSDRRQFIVVDASPVTHCDHRDLFVSVVVGNASSARIQPGLAINQKPVLVMAMGEWDLQGPPTVDSSLHCKRGAIGEIALKLDELGVRRMAVKVYWFGHVPGRIGAWALFFFDRFHDKMDPWTDAVSSG